MINLSRSSRLYKVNRKFVAKRYAAQVLKLGNNVELKNLTIHYNNYISNDCKLVNVELGDFSYTGASTQIMNTTIGKYCSIADNVTIGLGFHPTDRVSSHPAFYSHKKPFKCFAEETSFEEYKKTIIENDVWIGSNVIIFGGVTIGNGAIVAGGAIVTKDVEPYAIVGGNPAKVIRYRFEEGVIKKLISFKWWDKDSNWIKDNHKTFNNVAAFLKLIE